MPNNSFFSDIYPRIENMAKYFVFIDDDEDDQLILKTTINGSFKNHEFKGFLCFDRAFDFLKKNSLSSQIIVFLDLNMPKVDGVEAIHLLRQDVKFKNVPIYIYSTSNNPDDINRCLIAGANGFITKPSKISDIKEKLENILLK